MFFRLNSKSDRRRHGRQLLNTSVRVFTASGCLEGIGINVSGFGMCLFTMANLPIGSGIHVEFRPSWSTESRRISATVRHRAFYLYGIEFEPDSVERGSGDQVREPA